MKFRAGGPQGQQGGEGGQGKSGTDKGGEKSASGQATAAGAGQQEQQQLQGADTIHIQMAFLFAIIWGVCSTITGAS